MPRKNVPPCEIAPTRRPDEPAAGDNARKGAAIYDESKVSLLQRLLSAGCAKITRIWLGQTNSASLRSRHAMRMYAGRKSRAGYQSGDSLAVENSKSPLNVAPTYRADQARQSLSGVLAHFFRASRMVGKGQPSLFARSRTTDCRRFKAAVARISEAPCATSSLRRSSSSGVQRCINGRISMSEDCCTHRKKSRANPDEGRGSLFGKLASVS
jgi:hypothetical protein